MYQQIGVAQEEASCRSHWVGGAGLESLDEASAHGCLSIIRAYKSHMSIPAPLSNARLIRVAVAPQLGKARIS
jgi:hypothetical protein